MHLQAHHATASTYLRVLDHFGARQPGSRIMLWGCSATLRRHDGISLGSVFEKVPPPTPQPNLPASHIRTHGRMSTCGCNTTTPDMTRIIHCSNPVLDASWSYLLSKACSAPAVLTIDMLAASLTWVAVSLLLWLLFWGAGRGIGRRKGGVHPEHHGHVGGGLALPGPGGKDHDGGGPYLT